MVPMSLFQKIETHHLFWGRSEAHLINWSHYPKPYAVAKAQNEKVRRRNQTISLAGDLSYQSNLCRMPLTGAGVGPSKIPRQAL